MSALLDLTFLENASDDATITKQEFLKELIDLQNLSPEVETNRQ